MTTRRRTGPATTTKARTATRRQFLTIASATVGTTTVSARSQALAEQAPSKAGMLAKKKMQVALICIADWAGAVRQVLSQLVEQKAIQIGDIKVGPIGGNYGCPPNQKVDEGLCKPSGLIVGAPVSLADLSNVLHRIEESAESLRRGIIDPMPPDAFAPPRLVTPPR